MCVWFCFLFLNFSYTLFYDHVSYNMYIYFEYLKYSVLWSSSHICVCIFFKFLVYSVYLYLFVNHYTIFSYICVFWIFIECVICCIIRVCSKYSHIEVSHQYYSVLQKKEVFWRSNHIISVSIYAFYSCLHISNSKYIMLYVCLFMPFNYA